MIAKAAATSEQFKSNFRSVAQKSPNNVGLPQMDEVRDWQERARLQAPEHG